MDRRDWQPEPFDTFFKREQRALKARVRNLLGRRYDELDGDAVVQCTALSLSQKWDDLPQELNEPTDEGVRKFAFGILHNLVRTAWRRSRQLEIERSVEPASPPASPEQIVIQKLVTEVGMARMARTTLDVFELVRGEGYTIREAAEILEIPEGTAKTRLRKAVGTLLAIAVVVLVMVIVNVRDVSAAPVAGVGPRRRRHTPRRPRSLTLSLGVVGGVAVIGIGAYSYLAPPRPSASSRPRVLLAVDVGNPARPTRAAQTAASPDPEAEELSPHAHGTEPPNRPKLIPPSLETVGQAGWEAFWSRPGDAKFSYFGPGNPMRFNRRSSNGSQFALSWKDITPSDRPTEETCEGVTRGPFVFARCDGQNPHGPTIWKGWFLGALAPGETQAFGNVWGDDGHSASAWSLDIVEDGRLSEAAAVWYAMKPGEATTLISWICENAPPDFAPCRRQYNELIVTADERAVTIGFFHPPSGDWLIRRGIKSTLCSSGRPVRACEILLEEINGYTDYVWVESNGQSEVVLGAEIDPPYYAPMVEFDCALEKGLSGEACPRYPHVREIPWIRGM